MNNVMYLLADLAIGGNKGIINLIKYLDKSKYRLMVCCLYEAGPYREVLDSLNIKVEVLNFSQKKLSSFIRLIKLLKINKIDILHTYCFIPNAIGRIAGILAGVAVVICSEWALVNKRSHFQLFLDWLFSFFTKKIIAISEAVKKSIVLYEKIYDSKITVIYNCIDLDEFKLRLDQDHISSVNQDNTEPVLAMVANFRWEKAHHIFLKSAKIIVAQYPNAKFLLIGDGVGLRGQKLKKEIEALVNVLGISQNVIFMGHRKNIPELLKKVKIKVLPSLSEGMSLAIIEAMALSKPIVATWVGGTPEVVVDGITGLLVPPNDEVALAKAILRILGDRELAYRMGAEGRRRVEEIFDARKIVKKIEAVYQQALKN